MPIIATATQSKTFTPAPEGTHQAVCVDVIDLGMKETTWQGKLKVQHKIDLVWQIAELRDDGKPYQVYKRYTLSLNEKASLRHDLQSWRGRPFTVDEDHEFDVETVIGANCLVNIQHRTVADKTYANVVSVMPLIKGMTKIVAMDYKRPELKATTEPTDDEAPVSEDVTFDPREYDDGR